MTKAEVITKISEKTGIQKDDVTQTVEAFFKVVKDSMAEGENIYVRGFGSFINKKRAKKIARNISKNTAIVIDEHYVPAFKPSKSFIEKINEIEIDGGEGVGIVTKQGLGLEINSLKFILSLIAPSFSKPLQSTIKTKFSKLVSVAVIAASQMEPS